MSVALSGVAGQEPASPRAAPIPQNPYRELRFEQFPEPPEAVESSLPSIAMPNLPAVAMPSATTSAAALAATVSAAATAESLAVQYVASLTSPRLYTLGADGALIVIDVPSMTRLHSDNAPGNMGVIAAAAVSKSGGRVALATAIPMSAAPVVLCPGNSLARGVPAMLDLPGAAAKRIKLNSPRKQAQGGALARKAALDPAEAKRIAQAKLAAQLALAEAKKKRREDRCV